MEYLDLIAEDGQPTGQRKERSLIHRDGDLHRTGHVWITRKNPQTGTPQLLLQKRSDGKDAYPGCYDISSAGHVPAGSTYLDSALRELQEELGLTVKPQELQFLFYHKGYSENIFYGQPFRNYEYSAVYLCRTPVTLSALQLQPEEVAAVCWADYEEILAHARTDDPRYCLFVDELEAMKEHLL